MTIRYELRAGRGSYGIYRGKERVATISTDIMDQREVGELMVEGLNRQADLRAVAAIRDRMREEIAASGGC